MMARASYRTVRTVLLSLLLVTSVFGGVVAFSEPASATTTAQLDFTGIYNADVVRGTSDNTDGDFDNGGYTLVSSSTAQNNGNPAEDGIPDDGVFATKTDVHPKFDLADFDSADSNAWQTTGTGSVMVSVSPGQYETVHVVASAGGAGPSTPAKFKLKLHYADGSTKTSQVFTVPDWFGAPPSDPGYAVRDGMDRYGTGYEDANEPGLWGYAVTANSSKSLQQVTINVTENAAGSFNFFGGAATTQESTVVNGAPAASADSATTDEDTTVTVDVIENDSDPDGDSLNVTAITNVPSHGTARITGASDDEIQFDPGENATADVSITYEVNDGNGGTDTATLAVAVTPVNDAPVASVDTATVDEDSTVIVDVIANDSDVDGDELDVSAITSGPSHGTARVTGGSNDTIEFTPAQDATADVSITYEVSDGNGGTDTATLTVAVTPVNDAPVVSDSSVTTGEDTAISVADGDGGDLLETASDVDSDALSIGTVDGTSFSSGDAVALESGATVTVESDGSWSYDPNGQFEWLSNGDTATDTFDYTVTDGNDLSGEGTVTVTITGVTDEEGGTQGRRIVAGEDSVTASLHSAPVERVRATFGVATSGSVTITPVESLPSGAPPPDGRLLGAVEVTPPADARAEPGSIRITVFRSTIDAMGVTPSQLRIVRYADADNDLDRLKTRVADAEDRRVVLAAETPGFSVFGVVVATSSPTAKADVTATATPPMTVTSTATPTLTPTPQTRTVTAVGTTSSETTGDGVGFDVAVALAALAATILALRRG
jgi:PGF-pre-PGF domain-containing protein